MPLSSPVDLICLVIRVIGVDTACNTMTSAPDAFTLASSGLMSLVSGAIELSANTGLVPSLARHRAGATGCVVVEGLFHDEVNTK